MPILSLRATLIGPGTPPVWIGRAASERPSARAVRELLADPAQARRSPTLNASSAFLVRYAGTPLADRLRIEWLKSLAKREQWALFATNIQNARATTPSSTATRSSGNACAMATPSSTRRARTGPPGRINPESCQQLFAAMLKTQRLSTDDIWARFRLAHEAGNARLAARVVARTAVPGRPSRAARAGTCGAQRGAGAGERRIPPYLGDRPRARPLRAGSRRARRRRGRARSVAQGTGTAFPEADRRYGNLLVAHQAARQLNPAANAWYRDAEGARQNAGAARMARARGVARARSGLTLRAPSTRCRMTRRWIQLGATGRRVRSRQPARREDSTRLYAGLATEHHFYGLMAAEALGAAIMPVSEPLPPDRPGTRRIRRARRGAARGQANCARPAPGGIARMAVCRARARATRRLLLAAEFARRNGLYDRSINSADRTQRRHDFALRYQTPYQGEIVSAARDVQLDEALGVRRCAPGKPLRRRHRVLRRCGRA